MSEFNSEIAYANDHLQRQMQRTVYGQISELTTRELSRRRLEDFTTYTKSDFAPAPHHKLICRHLDMLISGKIRFLRIEMPPRHGKSELGSVRLPAYFLGRNPHQQLIHISHSASLSNDFSRQVRDIVQFSPRYRELFPKTVLSKTRARIDDWKTSLGGGFFSLGTGGSVEGHGAHGLIIDDPMTAEDADSMDVMTDLWNWYIRAARTRLMPLAWICVIMQRWSPFDLAGQMGTLAESDPNADQYTVLRLPAIAGDNDPLGREKGQALWPEWYSLPTLYAIRAASHRHFDALFQQEPRSSDAALFSKEGFKTDWVVKADFPPAAWCFDLAITEKDTSDYSTVGRWQYDRGWGNLFVSNIRRYRRNWPKMKKLIKRLIRMFPHDDFVFPPDQMELMAVQELRDELPKDAHRIKTIERTKFKGDKTSRAQVLSDRCAEGQVYVTEGRHSTFFINEHVKYPDAHDDFVDMSSVATHHFRLNELFDVVVKSHSPSRNQFTDDMRTLLDNLGVR
jgi:hypothetical protein